MNKNAIGLEIAKKTESDAQLVMKWRNDVDTLRASFHSEPKTWELFYPEYKHYFTIPDLPPLFLLIKENRVGFVYFKLIKHPQNIAERRCVEISINIAPEFRGRGVGEAALQMVSSWVKQQGYDDLYAVVKLENQVSIKTFINAGFERLPDGTTFIEDLDRLFPIARLITKLNSSPQHSVFIIAEAGSNWRVGTPEKDLKMGKDLIEVAAKAGANAIKFQVFKPETIYVANAGKSGYLTEAGIEQEMQDIFTNLAMPYEMIPLLAEHCNKFHIEFMATAFSPNDFNAIDPYVKRHKIASYEIGHIHLIELAARSGKPTFISTGAATQEEIDWAVQTFQKSGGRELTLMQCTAKYPAEAAAMNLRALVWLKNRYQCTVGLSDHSLGAEPAPGIAVSLGGKAIEKHFTLDKAQPGPDHSFALNPLELTEMITTIRQTEKMLGSWVKEVHPSEEELRHFARRGIQAIRQIPKGEVLQEGVNIDILRPGQQPLGVHSKHLIDIEGKKASRTIPLGHGIQLGDWE